MRRPVLSPTTESGAGGDVRGARGATGLALRLVSKTRSLSLPAKFLNRARAAATGLDPDTGSASGQ